MLKTKKWSTSTFELSRAKNRAPLYPGLTPASHIQQERSARFPAQPLSALLIFYSARAHGANKLVKKTVSVGFISCPEEGFPVKSKIWQTIVYSHSLKYPHKWIVYFAHADWLVLSTSEQQKKNKMASLLASVSNVTNKVTLWSASYSVCVVYTKTIIHFSVSESFPSLVSQSKIAILRQYHKMLTSQDRRKHLLNRDTILSCHYLLYRAAATRCREKRKIWVTQLEKKAEDLTVTNTQLQV